MKAEEKHKSKIKRRQVLNAAAAGAGLAVGSGLVRGFPTIWAQNVKDIKLVQVGGSYSNIVEIANQATKELGFTVEMQAIDPDAQTNRTLTQPKSIDINDLGTFLLYYFVGQKIVQPIPASKYKYLDMTRRKARNSPLSRPSG
jgi:putative spermidine/putrescine transport system substrate-binding protein